MDLAVIKHLSDNSPYYRLLGMQVVDLRPGYCRIDLDVEQHLMQSFGSLHGGAISSVVDTAGGTAVISSLDEPVKVVTIEMKVNYIASISGGRLITEANVVHKGKRTAVSEVRATSDDGRLIAIGICTYMLIEGARLQPLAEDDEGSIEL